mgnify:CR=1 FL=1
MAGIPNSFIYSKSQRSRELISYFAVIMLVIRYQGTENKADELRKFLKPLLLPPALLQQSSTCTTSTTSPTVVLSTLNESPSTPARNCQPPTLACHPPAVTRNLSAVLSSVPNVLSSTCPSTLVGGPIHSTPSRYHSTKQLVDLQLKRRSQQSSGRKFASRPLVQRVKKQNEHLKQIAQGIHHDGKEDLLAGIAHSVSCSTTKQNCSGNDWDGQLTVQDILQLTKMVYDYKAGKTIYDTLTVDTASQIYHISIFQVLKMQDSISQKETFRNLRKQLQH